MNSEKPVSYEMISSDEDSVQRQQQGLEEAQDHDAWGTAAKRSYDCTYCKRGFTNAQALGGHMNIHRKDRAKAKQTIKPNPSSSSLSLHEEFMMMESHDQHQRNRDNYFHPQPPPTPKNNHFLIRNNNQPAPPPHAYQYHPHEFNHDPIMSHQQPMNFNSQELHGANWSLHIGPSDDHVGNPNYQVRRGAHKDSEVDLELRLGHDP